MANSEDDIFAAFFGPNSLNQLDPANENNHLFPAEQEKPDVEQPIENMETVNEIIDEQILRLIREDNEGIFSTKNKENEEDLLLSQQDALIGGEDVFDENGYRQLEEGEEEMLLANSPKPG